MIDEDISNVILSIDLDYFHSNDIVGETIIVEISRKAYENYVENRYHPFRLTYDNRCRIFRKNDQFYVEIWEFRDLKPTDIGYELIDKK